MNNRLKNSFNKEKGIVFLKKATPLLLFVLYFPVAQVVYYLAPRIGIRANSPIYNFIFWFLAGSILVAALYFFGKNIRQKNETIGKLICLFAVFIWVLGSITALFQFIADLMP